MCQDSPGDVALIMKLLPNIIGRKVLSEKLYRSRNYINIQILSLKKKKLMLKLNQCQFLILFHRNVKGC